MINPTHDSADVTRELFQDFSAVGIVLFYILGFIALGIFAWGCYLQIRKYRQGVADGSWADLLRRFRDLCLTMLTHRTLRRRDAAAGRAHAAIFFGFVLLFIGTSLIFIDYDILGPLGLSFWHGEFYLLFQLTLDLAGLALIIGLVYMMVRRGWIKPPKLDYRRPDREPGEPDADRSAYRIEDWAFLWALIIIGVTGFLLNGSRKLWLIEDPLVWDYRWWTPVGTSIAYALSGLGLSSEGAGVLRTATWWFHGVLALAFVAAIPFTKVKHIFTAGGSLMLRDPLAAQRLPKLPEEGEDAGYGRITDFSRKHLLHLDACTKCGRCHEACPANASGLPLSPRDLVLTLREFAHDNLEGKPKHADELIVHGDGVHQIRAETLWACRTCMACVEICPVAIEHVPIIVQMRRWLVEQGEMDPMLQGTLQKIQKRGNSFGEAKRKRGKWADELDFPVKDARKEPVDFLWFVGDYASFDPRNQSVTRDFARILHHAEVDFGILYDAEQNAGNDVRRVGEEGLYEMLAEGNVATLEDVEFERLVTTDPHSLNTIRNEYPQFGGQYLIYHYTSLLKQLIEEGRLHFQRTLNYRVTYHDPCHLGRFNRGFDAPRYVMQALGLDLVEMDRSGENSFCCGAGGGRIWMADPPGKEKPSENRMHEAARIEGLEVFVVACPKDLTMFEDALKTSGYEGQFVVRELNELVAEALALDGQATEAA